jgi:hypothetical protein
MIAYYKQGQLVRIRMALYIAYFLLSMGLVWQFSYLGLAWAKIIIEIGILLTTFYCALKLCPAVATIKRFIWPTVICLVPTISLVLTGYKVWLVIVVFVALFSVTGFFYSAIQINDFKLLKEWLAKQLGQDASDEGSGLTR